MGTSAKTGRVEIRITEEERHLAELAAAELGQPLSEFVRQAARARAEEVLVESGRITLARDAAQRFLEALDDEQPTAGLQELFDRVDLDE